MATAPKSTSSEKPKSSADKPKSVEKPKSSSTDKPKSTTADKPRSSKAAKEKTTKPKSSGAKKPKAAAAATVKKPKVVKPAADEGKSHPSWKDMVKVRPSTLACLPCPNVLDFQGLHRRNQGAWWCLAHYYQEGLLIFVFGGRLLLFTAVHSGSTSIMALTCRLP